MNPFQRERSDCRAHHNGVKVGRISCIFSADDLNPVSANCIRGLYKYCHFTIKATVGGLITLIESWVANSKPLSDA